MTSSQTSSSSQQTEDPNREVESQSSIFEFWQSERINKQGELKWKIDHLKFIEFLQQSGFKRFDINDDYIFIQIKDQLIDEIPVVKIQDHVIQYIKSLVEGDLEGVTKDELLSLIYRSPAIYFNEKKLSILGVEENLKFVSDDKETGSIFYKNGFVKCSADGYKLKPYSDLDGYLFKNQIKEREFKEGSDEGMFRQFVYNISGKNESRFESLKTLTGYLLHSFFETKMKAINLTDSTISDNAEGRSGKTLHGRAIAYIKEVCEISGKDFDTTNKHKYASVSISSQIVFLNDLRKRFDFESLFNDISDAITVDRKNLQPFTIRAKMLISSNDTFRIEGASARDRVVEFELANHYNADYSPEDEFKCWFFRDWDEKEWSMFDNFMCGCLVAYLKNGIIEPDQINLDKRKLRNETNPDFVDFMDEKIDSGEILLNKYYDKKDLLIEFLDQYPEYNKDKYASNPRIFNKYLRKFGEYALKATIEEMKSNKRGYIKFKSRNVIESNLTKSEAAAVELPF